MEARSQGSETGVSLPERPMANCPLQTRSPIDLDSATGRTDAVPSGISGCPLRYFTPYPLELLLERCRGLETRWQDEDDFFLPLALARAASGHGTSRKVDEQQVRRLGATLLSRAVPRTSEALFELVPSIAPKAGKLREQIVFSGGPSASHANHIYAPHGALPELLESLLAALGSDLKEISPTAVSALVGFFCVHMHPFVDGNGRWSRVVAVSAGAQAGSATSAIIGAIVQCHGSVKLADDIWPVTRSYGLRGYLQFVHAFETEFRSSLVRSAIPEEARHLSQEIMGACKDRRRAARILIELYASTQIPLANLRTALGLSQRSFEGLTERLRARRSEFITVSDQTLGTNTLLNEIQTIATDSIQRIQQGA
jgi:hypothetical protein